MHLKRINGMLLLSSRKEGFEMSETLVRISVAMNQKLREKSKELAKTRGLDLSSMVRTLLIREIEIENDKKK